MTPSRRSFLAASAAAVATTAATTPGAFAAGTDPVLRVGLVGVGGRGMGAAKNALLADPKVKLVALCDAFMDRLQDGLKNLKAVKAIADKIDVTPDRCFDGFDGFTKLLDCGVDVVLLCTPPGFRPQHLRAAVAAGKHVFCEKPVAVDAPGVRSVIETAKLAKEKGTSLCSGFCFRYDPRKRETVKRVHDGAVGDVMAIHGTFLTSPLWHRGEKAEWTPMEYQMRNWYYYSWLSGDFIVEQHCHNLDKAAWLMKGEMPVSCTALGGRQQRVEAKFGNIYDHFSSVFEYAGGAKLFSYCRQMAGCVGDINDHVLGTKGQCQLMKHTITPHAGAAWTYDGDEGDMYQIEHNELFAGIRAGRPINDGEAAARSTLMAVLGRQAAYTGKKITWEQMLNSKEDLSPKSYAWGPNEVPGVPMPGVTKFA